MSSGKRKNVFWKTLFDQFATLMHLIQEGKRDAGQVSQVLQNIIDNVTVGATFPSQLLAADLIPERWIIESDVEPTVFEVSDLEFIPFLNEGDDPINGDLMREHALTLKANLGLADGKKLLAQQDKIPVELRGKWIALTGTVLCDRDAKRHVAYLGWNDDRWYLSFCWLVHGWDSNNRLARRK